MDINKNLVQKNKTIKETMNIIDHNGLGIAFVVDENKKLVGVVTDGDIRRSVLKGINLNTQIQKIMKDSPVTAKEGWRKGEIKNMLKKDDFRRRIPPHGTMRIPVVDNNNEVVDIIFASEDRYESEMKSYFESGEKTVKIKPVNKVLVVGGAGYLGSVLCHKLIEKEYNVKVLDNLTYGNHGIKDLYNHSKFEFIKGDMRNIQTVVDAVKDVDAVIHLAAIVGDPASALNPKETLEINYFGAKMLAEVCKYGQVNRFIFASTCSVYGASSNLDTKINENSAVKPVSLYAEMKLKSEEGILGLADENFSPTILRMGTLYGLSPRMRFDLVVNILTMKALMENKIRIFGGEQWRPNLHVSDACNAYIKCLEEPMNVVRGEIFNVGSNDENYKIIEIGEMIKSLIPETKMIVDKKDIDERDYNVSFDKIRKALGYSTSNTVTDGIEEIKESVSDGKFKDYANPKYSNYKFLQESAYSE